MKIWTVKIVAAATDIEHREDVGITGEIHVKAKDIFQALDIATKKVKTFGYDSIMIEGIVNGDTHESK